MDSDGLVGMRFKPTNEEIVFLLKMKRLDPDFSVQTIKEIDIYSFEPWELPGFSEIQAKEEVWYFYCEPYYKYAKSKRAHRRTKTGYWKVTGKGSDMKAKNDEVIATKKILPFCADRHGTASKRAKTEWVMHEIAVEDDDPRYKKDFVVCRLERKRNNKLGVSSYGDQSIRDLASCSSMDVTGDFFSESLVTSDQRMDFNINHVAENSVSSTNHVAENTSKGLQLEPTDDLESPIQPNHQCLAAYSSNIVGYSFDAEPPPPPAEFNPHGGYNELNDTSVYPEQESPYSSGSNYGSDVLNTLSDSEQIDYQINSQCAFQKETPLEETGQTFTPDFDEYPREATGQAFIPHFNSSKSDGKVYEMDSRDEGTESFLAWVKKQFEN